MIEDHKNSAEESGDNEAEESGANAGVNRGAGESEDLAVGGAVEGAIADGFGYMIHKHGGGHSRLQSFLISGGIRRGQFQPRFQIRNRARHAQDAVEGPCAHIQFLHAVFQLRHPGGIRPCVFMQQP